MPSRAASPITPEFLEEEITVRGITYHFRELSIGEYDELMRKATTKSLNPLTGQEDETIDNALLLRLMVLRCCIDPKLTPETLAGLPMRVSLKFNQTVNRMHYGDEPETPKKDDSVEEEPAKGND